MPKAPAIVQHCPKTGDAAHIDQTMGIRFQHRFGVKGGLKLDKVNLAFNTTNFQACFEK